MSSVSEVMSSCLELVPSHLVHPANQCHEIAILRNGHAKAGRK